MTLLPLTFIRRLLERLGLRKPKGPPVAYVDATQKLAAAFTREYMDELSRQENPMLKAFKKKETNHGRTDSDD